MPGTGIAQLGRTEAQAEPLGAFTRLGRQHPRQQPVLAPLEGIAREPGQQAGRRERRLAGARRPDDDEEPSRGIGEPGEQLVGLGTAPEEDRRVVRRKGAEARERRAGPERRRFGRSRAVTGGELLVVWVSSCRKAIRLRWSSSLFLNRSGVVYSFTPRAIEPSGLRKRSKKARTCFH